MYTNTALMPILIFTNGVVKSVNAQVGFFDPLTYELKIPVQPQPYIVCGYSLPLFDAGFEEGAPTPQTVADGFVQGLNILEQRLITANPLVFPEIDYALYSPAQLERYFYTLLMM